MARVASQQAQLVRSLVLWARRRSDGVGAGVVPLAYGREQVLLLAVVTPLTIVEVAAVEFLVPWAGLRLVLLVAGVWSTVVMAGYVAASRVRPHTVGATHLRVRCALAADLLVPLDQVLAVRRIRASAEYGLSVAGDVVTVGVAGQVVLAVRLAGPLEDGDPAVRGALEVRFAVDDPAAALAVLRPAVARAASGCHPGNDGGVPGWGGATVGR